jgi:UDP-N-acetylglucosamine:LPS N-acetylglucosamine transferase
VIVVTRADHREHAAAFAAHGTAQLVDMSEGPRPDELVELVSETITRPERLESMAARGRALVDGRGAQRVAQAIRDIA